MSENQKKILQMLAEGKISVSEAERLLSLITSANNNRNESNNSTTAKAGNIPDGQPEGTKARNFSFTKPVTTMEPAYPPSGHDRPRAQSYTHAGQTAFYRTQPAGVGRHAYSIVTSVVLFSTETVLVCIPLPGTCHFRVTLPALWHVTYAGGVLPLTTTVPQHD